MTIEPREVLDVAYVNRQRSRPMLTHAVFVEHGRDLAVMCRRVKLDSLADRRAGDVRAPVTCRACLSAIKKVTTDDDELAAKLREIATADDWRGDEHAEPSQADEPSKP